MSDACTYIDLSFQRSLRASAEEVRAEIEVFRRMVNRDRWEITETPGYCITIGESTADDGAQWREILLKIRGVWTRLDLEERQPDVFVLYEH